MSSSVLVTGATGFIGGAVLGELHRAEDRPLLAAVRSADVNLPSGVQVIQIPDHSDNTDWSAAVEGIDAVVHCAARVHLMNDLAADPLNEFRRVNVAGTLRLARQAAIAGARRFVYISSVKVNGERTDAEHPFRESDRVRPEDPYGQSKEEAESGLREIGAGSSMEVTIVRLPLVYGPGVKGNFLSLMKLANTGFPLPFGGINNRRSLIYLGNLVHFIEHLLDHPKAANETFLVSDGDDLSTPELIRRLRWVAGRRPRLLPVPVGIMRLAGRLTGRSVQLDRLCESLRVDPGKARDLINWSPPYTVDQGISFTVRHWLGQ